MKTKIKCQNGLIIYRKEKEKIVKQIIEEVLSLYKLRNTNNWIGYKTSVGKHKDKEKTIHKYIAFQIRQEAFWNYSQFDDFLIQLGQILDDIDELGLVIGHIDNCGFIWMDYNNHEHLSNEIKKIKEKYRVK